MTRARGPLIDVTPPVSITLPRHQDGSRDGLPPLRSNAIDSDNGPSRFKKAIRDPDWRSRSSESTEPESIHLGHGFQHTAAPTTLQRSKSARSEAKLNHEADENLQHSIFEDFAALKGPTTNHRAEVSSASNRSLQSGLATRTLRGNAVLPRSTADQGIGLASVRRHAIIPGLTASGQPMSLIKLQPLSGALTHNTSLNSQAYGIDPTVVEVIHLKRTGLMSHGLGVDNTQYLQPATATTGSTSVSAPTRAALSGVDFDRSIYGPSSAAVPRRNIQEAQLNDPAIVMMGKRVDETMATVDFLTAFPQRASEPQQAVAKQDAAYRKILQKLNHQQSSEPIPDDTLYGNRKQPGRITYTSQDTQIHWPLPTESSDRRSLSQNYSGDSGYASLSTNDESKDPVVPQQPPKRPSDSTADRATRRFNPRARDFLSLVAHQEAVGNSPFNGQALEETNQGYVNPYGLPNSLPVAMPENGSLPPFHTAANHLNGALTWLFRADQSQPPILGIIPLTNNGPFAPPFAMVNSQPAWSSVAPPASAFVPGTTANCPQPPTSNIPVAASCGPPRPVPKPRAPNASDQQKYEEYIEMRKATTPGYALECRMRQQQRAQKKLENRRNAASDATGPAGAASSTH